MRAGKVWGITELITANPAFEYHRIHIKAGGYCSIHKHQTKSNGFYVDSGLLMIRTWNPDGSVDETLLKGGDYTAVPPGVSHQFEAIEETVAFELYWAQYNPDDISRETVGGMRDRG